MWSFRPFHAPAHIQGIFLNAGFSINFITGLPHDKTNKMACTPSEDSDQPGHPLKSLQYPQEESFGP